MPVFAVQFDLALPAATFLFGLFVLVLVSRWMSGNAVLPKISQLALSSLAGSSSTLSPSPSAMSATDDTTPSSFTSSPLSGETAEALSLVYVTAPTAEVAGSLSRGVVERELAACVNILPGITSVYRWEGKIESDPEVLMLIKTRSSRLEELTTFIRENHPYKVCEVIATDIKHGNPPYLDWIRESVPSSPVTEEK